MDQSAKIYVAGHRGLVGSALVRVLRQHGFENLLLRTHAELDLTNQVATRAFFERERPDYVLLAAAKVGGIHANNTYPALFIHQNLAIQTNVIQSAKTVCGISAARPWLSSRIPFGTDRISAVSERRAFLLATSGVVRGYYPTT